MHVRTGISTQQGMVSISETKRNHMRQGLGNTGGGGGGGGGMGGRGGKTVTFSFFKNYCRGMSMGRRTCLKPVVGHCF